MKQADNNREKLYYFSGSYSMVSRILNIEFDPCLVFIHNVLQTAYGTLNQTLQNIQGGQERVIILPDTVFEKLTKDLHQLSNAIEKDQDIYPVLQSISNIAYSATGNGFYLFQKGLLKIS
jgi:hypothetical protein